MQIDSHQHFWRYTEQDYAWIDESMGVLRRDFLPVDLKPRLDAAGIGGCVAVQAQETHEETRWLLRLADQHAWIRGVVGWVDPESTCLEADLDAIAHPRLVGVRAVLQAKPDSCMGTPAFAAGMRAIGRRGLVYDVLVHARQLRAAIGLCRAFPEQAFVLDHFGKPDVRGGGLTTWARDVRELAAMPNVCCKVSGLATEADWAAWTEPDLRRYFDVAAECFGPDRLLFGSDWPVALCATGYQRWRDTVAGWTRAWPAGEREALLGSNAARIYRLG